MKPQKGATETRTVSCANVRADATKYQITGVAAAYEILSADLGGFFEKIARGTFTRSLEAKADVKALLNHDSNRILGRTKSGTLVLSDSPEGLRFVCQLDKSNSDHANVYASVRRGDLSDCSFAFTVVSDSWQGNIRTLQDVNLLDVSVVTTPAYPQGTNASARAAYTIARPTDAMIDACNRQAADVIGQLVAADMREIEQDEGFAATVAEEQRKADEELRRRMHIAAGIYHN